MAAVSLAAQHPPPPAATASALPPRRHARSTRRSTASSAKLADVAAAHRPERRPARPGRRRSTRSPTRSTAPADGDGEPRTRADLPVHLRPPAVPRPPQGGRRLRLLASFGEEKAASPVEAVQRDPPRRPAARRPHHRLVRQPEQPEPDLRPPGPPRVRAPGPLPDERQRLQHPDRLPRRRQARRRTAPSSTARRRAGSRSSAPTPSPTTSGSPSSADGSATAPRPTARPPPPQKSPPPPAGATTRPKSPTILAPCPGFVIRPNLMGSIGFNTQSGPFMPGKEEEQVSAGGDRR